MMEIDLVVSEVSKQIYHVRGARVMLDSDLAQLFQIETRTLNQTVRRNVRRFPEDFMFQLRKDEFETLISQIVISKIENRGGTKKLPLAFTELGVGMLSCILNNDRAIQVSITAFRAFGQVRQLSEFQTDILKKVDYLEQGFHEFKQVQVHFEKKFDDHIQSVGKPSDELLVDQIPSNNKLKTIFSRYEENGKIEKIQTEVSKYFGLKEHDLKGKSRAGELIIPRQIAVYLIRKHTQISFKLIGKYFGGKDHTTIIYSWRKISTEIILNKGIRETVENIEELLQRQNH